MKKYLLFLKNKSLTLILVLMVSFFLSFFIVDLYNQENSYYEAGFEVSNIEMFETDLLNDKDFLNSIKESGNGKYDFTDVDKMLEKGDFKYFQEDNYIIIQTKYKYYETFFLSSINNISSRAKMFIKDSVLKIAEERCEVFFDDEKNIVSLKNNINRWIASLQITLIICLLLIIITILYVSFSKKEITKQEKVYDNENLFATIFHKRYWKLALAPLIKVKDITVIAMLFALMIISKLIPIPSGFGSLGLSFTYLFFSIISMIYGPVYGFVIGIFSDIIGYFLPTNGGGVFNFGYTLQAALTGFIYGICFYRTKITFSKSLVARMLVNFLMNTIYGSFLFIFVMYFNNTSEFDINNYLIKVKYYMLLISLPKNVLYLLPQSLLLYYVLKAVTPVLQKSKIINYKTKSDKKSV